VFGRNNCASGAVLEMLRKLLEQIGYRATQPLDVFE
jgi:hypothetical protein